MIIAIVSIVIAVNIQVCVSQTIRISLPSFPPDFFEPTRQKTGCIYESVGNCNASAKYRTINGSCNNLAVPWMGMAFTPYKRMFKSSYDSESNIVTKSAKGVPLPEARNITQTLFVTSPKDRSCQDDPFWPVLMVSFCQFLTHDVASAKLAIDANGSVLQCPCNSTHPNCMSFPINSPHFPDKCNQMPRAASANEILKCNFTHRESVNTQTAYLDLSHVYGVSVAENMALRTGTGGLLRTSPGLVKDCPYLPITNHSGSIKFVAGDVRTNENLGLVAMHTLFLREHNRLATELARIRPTFNDETLFQEARRINIAQYQHIIYTGLMPILIGSDYAGQMQINVPSGFSNTYNASTNSSISTEFAGAAFRAGHAINAQIYSFTNSENRASFPRNLPFNSIVENSSLAYDVGQGNGVDTMCNSIMSAPMSKFGNCFAHSMMNCLHVDDVQPCIDLPATNINRGRDLGLPCYKFVRDTFNVYTSQNRTLTDILKQDVINALLRLYNNDLEAIDLFVGGILELIRSPTTGPPLLPCTTFGLIIAKTIQEWKFGDRYFYDYPFPLNPGGFTSTQIGAIKRQSLSRLICLNFPFTRVLNDAFVLGPILGTIACNRTTMALDLRLF